MEAVRCELCSEVFSNVELYHEHLNHEVHLRNARSQQTYKCEICKGGYSGETTFLAHIRGRPHEKQMNTMSQLANREKLAMIRGEADSDLACGTSSSKVLTTKDGPYHVCKDCKALCNTEDQLRMHQQGQKCRKKRLQQMDEIERSMSLPRNNTKHKPLPMSSSGMVNPSEFPLDRDESDSETSLNGSNGMIRNLQNCNRLALLLALNALFAKLFFQEVKTVEWCTKMVKIINGTFRRWIP